LESKYSESGYYNSIITPSLSIDSQNRAGIILTIDQGERVKIDTFSISGAEKIDEESLLKLFKIGEPDMFILITLQIKTYSPKLNSNKE
jgi:outer membrane protein assembly factor BamA